jgi:hypothetical protein
MARSWRKIQVTLDPPKRPGQKSPKATSEWREPQAGWIPIGRGVFRFGIAGSDETCRIATALLSPEAFRSRHGDPGPERDYEPNPSSLEKLSRLLRENARAREVHIDQDGGHFHFGFDLPGGGRQAPAELPG